MINGTGPDVGQVMAGHPDVDMVSFTGSTRAGIIVAETAAKTVKRVAPGARRQVGQHHPARRRFRARGAGRASTPASATAASPATRRPACWCRPPATTRRLRSPGRRPRRTSVGDPRSEDTKLGPVVSEIQFNKIQGLIEKGIAEGATLVTGGLGRPEHLNRGYYIRPTVFGHVKPGMTIEKEEIFGPVLSVVSYEDEDDAVKIANDTVYGLAAYVQSKNIEHARVRCRQAPRGSGVDQLSGVGHVRPLRRLQAVRQRPRICRLGDPRFSRGQGDYRVRGVTWRIPRPPECGGEVPSAARRRGAPRAIAVAPAPLPSRSFGTCDLSPTFVGARKKSQASSSPRPAFAIWPLSKNAPCRGGEVGKRGTGPSLSIISTWRGFRAPPAISVPVRSAAPRYTLPCRALASRLCARPARTARSGGRGTLGRDLPGRRLR